MLAIQTTTKNKEVDVARTKNKKRLFGQIETSDSEFNATREELLTEAELCPSSGLPLDAHHTVDEWLNDPRYKELNSEALSWLVQSLKADDCIRTVADIYLSMLLAGGISFERPNYQMDEKSAAWFNLTWQHWLADLERQKKAVGFAACRIIPHPTYIGKPTCLDLTQCHVLYRLDVDSIPHFVFFEKVSDPTSMVLGTKPTPDNHTFMNYRYLPGVVVYYDTPPSKEGAFLSSIASLLSDMDVHYTLRDALKLSTRTRAAPILVTMAPTLSHNAQDMAPSSFRGHAASTGMSVAFLGDGDKPHEEQEPVAEPDAGPGGMFPLPVSQQHAPGSSSSSSSSSYDGRPRNPDINTQAGMIYERQKYEYSRALSMYGPNRNAMATRMARYWISQMGADGMREHPLARGRTLGKQILAESPSDFMPFRESRMERVLNAFQIPKGMVSQTSSIGTGAKQSQDANCFVVFQNAQKQRRELMIAASEDMYTRIYSAHHNRQVLRDLVKSMAKQAKQNGGSFVPMSKEQGQKALAGTKAKIRMPGLPDDVLLDNLYTMGILTPEAYVKYKSSKHSIPVEDFETTPKMSLKDLNGVRPEPGAGTAQASAGIKSSRK